MKIWAPIKSKHSISLSHACLVLFQLCFLNSVMGGMLLWNLSFVPALFDLLHCEKVGIRLKKEMTESTDRVKRSLKTRERYLFMKASLDSRTKFEIKTLRNLKLELCHSILTWVSQHEPLRQFEVYHNLHYPAPIPIRLELMFHSHRQQTHSMSSPSNFDLE